MSAFCISLWIPSRSQAKGDGWQKDRCSAGQGPRLRNAAQRARNQPACVCCAAKSGTRCHLVKASQSLAYSPGRTYKDTCNRDSTAGSCLRTEEESEVFVSEEQRDIICSPAIFSFHKETSRESLSPTKITMDTNKSLRVRGWARQCCQV